MGEIVSGRQEDAREDDADEDGERFIWDPGDVEIVERADQEERTKPVSPPK